MSAPRLVARFMAIASDLEPPAGWERHCFVTDADAAKLEAVVEAAGHLLTQVLPLDGLYCAACHRIPEEHGHEGGCELAAYQAALAALKEGESG